MRSTCILIASLLCTVVPAAVAGVPPREEALVTLDDIGVRLQFDFYTADAAALRRDLARLAALEVPQPLTAMKLAYTGFGAWKLAEVLRGADGSAAAVAANDCSDALDKAVRLEPRAGLFALLSLCQRLATDLQGPVRSPLRNLRSRQNLERAVEIAPKDPRVLLVQGIQQYEQSAQAPDALASARARLAEATVAYDAAAAEPATDAFANALDWGQAEAWAYLGRVLLQLREAAAARDAFERALVIAGDYHEVRQLLQDIR